MFKLIRTFRNRQKSNKPLLILGSIVLSYSIGTGAFEFFLPILVENITNNLLLVGFLLALPSLIDLVFDIPIGALSDKLGRKKAISLGLFLMIILGFVFQQNITTIIILAILLLVWGLAYQLFNIPSTAYVMNISPKKKASEYYGTYISFMFLGLAIGPIIAGYLMEKNANLVFLFYSMMCALSLLIVFFFMKKIVRKEDSLAFSVVELIRKDRIILKELTDFSKLKGVGILVLYLTFLIAVFEVIIWTFEPIYFFSSGIDPLFGGLILSSFIIPLILFEIPGGMLSDKIGRTKVLLVGLIISGTFLMLFGSTTDQLMLVLFGFLTSTGVALIFPSIEGILVDSSKKFEKGEIVGVWNVAEDLGFVVGPIFGGFIANYFELGTTFVIIGVILLISIIPTMIILKFMMI